MTLRRLLHLPLVALLAVSLLVAPATASNYVWCFSADGGHSAVELAPAGDCSLARCGSAVDAVAASTLDAEDDCGACLDITSSHHANVSRCRQDQHPASLPAEFVPTATVALPLPIGHGVTARTLISFPPRAPDALRQHRTIVLLI